MKIEFPTKEELIQWLKNTTSAVLLSISLIGGVHEFYVQASSARVLANLVQPSHEYFPDGAYTVEYQQGSDDDSGDLIYTNIAVAFTLQARLAHHPERIIGGLESLKESLSDYTYIAKIEPHEAGYVGHLKIVIPENPNELEALKQVLENLSIAYIFPDGTGTINEYNLKMGKGLWV